MKKTLVILIVLALAGWGFWKWKGSAKGGDAPAWQKTEVSRGDMVIGVLATGNVQPQNRVAIKAPVSGRIEQILVREGNSVRRGQILAWMSSGDRASLLDAARAKGPEELKRWEDLYKAAPLIAPITGTIIARNVEPGQSVSASDSPLVVSDRLIIKAQVDETDIAKIKVGQEAKITLEAYPDQPVQATVDHIAYEARTVSNVTIYDVDVLPAKVPAFMRSGMTANVQFQIQAHRGVLILPSEAIQNDGPGGAYVFVPAPTTITVQSAEPEKKHEGKHGGNWEKWKNKKKDGSDSGQGENRNWNKNSSQASAGFQEWSQIPGAPLPMTRAVETDLTDGARFEITSGLKEGETVLIKALVLPSASTAKNPFSMTPARPAPRGKR